MISAQMIGRPIAYLIGLFVTWSWLSAARASFDSGLFDLATVTGGAGLVRVASLLALDSGATLVLAKLVACAKLGTGLLLFAGLLHAAAHRLRFGESDDEVLDVALLLAAIGTGVAVLHAAAVGTGGLIALAVEFLLCIVARELLVFPWRAGIQRASGGLSGAKRTL